MKKFNTIYWAISTVLSVCLLIICFFTEYDILFTYASLGVVLLLVPNFIIRSKENSKIKKIEAVYLNDCDPIKYIRLQEEEYKKMFHTKMAKYLHQVRMADFLCEAGKFDEAKEILEKIMEHENDLNSGILSLYYKVWITYFLEYSNFNRVQVLLEQLQSIAMNSSNRKMQLFATTMYYSCLSKYNVYTSRDLENTEKFYAALVNANQGKAYLVAGMYYLALIALKKSDNSKAIKRLEFVINNGNTMYVKEKAINILQKLK